MGLLITPTAPATLRTCFALPIASAYVRICRLLYDKDAKTVTLNLEYYLSEETAKALPRPQPCGVLGLPAQVVCSDPLEVLANSDGVPAYVVAYDFARAALEAALGNTATVTNAA